MKKFLIFVCTLVLLTSCVSTACYDCDNKDECTTYQNYLKKVATCDDESVRERAKRFDERIYNEAIQKYSKTEEEFKSIEKLAEYPTSRFKVLDEYHIALIDENGNYIVYEKLIKE